MNKETLRMQFLSGVITESEYKTKLEEGKELERDIKTFEDKIKTFEKELENAKKKIAKEKSKKNPNQETIERYLEDVEFVTDELKKDRQALKSYQKELKSKKESLNEHYVAGGIVGVGAITQIPSREKTDYEMAFEHFLGERYLTKFENREQDLEEIGIGAVLGATAVAVLAKNAYDKYKNYASRKGMKETGNEKKGSNGIVAKEYKLKDGSTYWGVTFEDKTRDQGYTDPRILLFSPERIEKVLNTDLKADESDEARMSDNYIKRLGQFTADKVIMLEGKEVEEPSLYEEGKEVDVAIYQEGKKWIVSHPVANRLEQKEFDSIEDAYAYYTKAKSGSPLNENNIDQLKSGIKGAFDAVRSLPLPDNAKLGMAKTGIGIATLNAIGQKISAGQKVSPEGQARLQKAMATIKQATSIEEIEQALIDALSDYASTNK